MLQSRPDERTVPGPIPIETARHGNGRVARPRTEPKAQPRVERPSASLQRSSGPLLAVIIGGTAVFVGAAAL